MWWWRRSVWVVLGRREKRRRTGRGAVEDGETGAALTQGREAVRRPSDDGKATAAEELAGGGVRARRGEEESGAGAAKIGWGPELKIRKFFNVG
jgi:hypothetical protein